MKKLYIRLAVIATLLALAATSLVALHAMHSQASHGPLPRFVFSLEHQAGKPGGSVSPDATKFTCSGARKGNLLVNVTEKVTNDADSGQAGDYWAFDTFTHIIQVWQTGGDDSYCAIVSYKGTFAAIAGQQSPGSVGGNGGILTGDEVGTFNGSAQLFITGPLNVSDPANWPLTGKAYQGNVVDYQCDSNGNCPGYVDWVAQYFDENAPGYSLSEPNWGWKYVGKDKPGSPDAGKSDGVWVNASSGNSGDILDVD